MFLKNIGCIKKEIFNTTLRYRRLFEGWTVTERQAAPISRALPVGQKNEVFARIFKPLNYSRRHQSGKLMNKFQQGDASNSWVHNSSQSKTLPPKDLEAFRLQVLLCSFQSFNRSTSTPNQVRAHPPSGIKKELALEIRDVNELLELLCTSDLCSLHLYISSNMPIMSQIPPNDQQHGTVGRNGKLGLPHSLTAI